MSADLLKNAPARDMEAERAVLGALFLDPAAVDLVAAELPATDFYRSSHRIVYQAILDMSAQGKPVDKLSVWKTLVARKQDEAAGGPVELDALTSSVPTTANALYYAGLVTEKARVRATQAVLESSLRRLYEHVEREDVDAVLDSVECNVFEATQSRSRREAPAAIGAVLGETLRKLDLTMQGKKWGVATGLSELDDRTNGLPKGEVTIIASRPSVGKSTLALNVARNVCYGDRGRSADRRVLFFSLEMTKTQVVENLLASVARVDSYKIRTGMLGQAERLEIDDAAAFLAQGRFNLVDGADVTVTQVRARARRAAREGGLDLVVLDYVQLMQTSDSGYGTPRHEQIANMSRGLKSLAVELDIPVLVVAQLNRKVDERGVGAKPKLSDLKDSGSLEQDAALVLLLHRRERTEEQAALPDDNETTIIIAKNRYGPCGDVKVFYDRRVSNFSDLVRDAPRAGMVYQRDAAALAAGEHE